MIKEKREKFWRDRGTVPDLSMKLRGYRFMIASEMPLGLPILMKLLIECKILYWMIWGTLPRILDFGKTLGQDVKIKDVLISPLSLTINQ